MNRGTAWYWFVVNFTRRCIFGVLGGTTVKGLDNVPKDGPVILAPIHVSYIDPMLVGCTSPRALRFMAKEELFKGILGWFLRSVGSFAVKRGGADSSAIRYAMQTLEEGNALMLFPEGTRSDGVTMGAIQSGVGMMAKKTGAQVVPIGIGGTVKMLPRDRKSLKRARLTIIYGKPFTYDEATSGASRTEAKSVFANRIAEEIQKLSAEAGMTLALPAEVKSED